MLRERYIELLPSKVGEGNTHIYWWEGFMKYAIGTGSDDTMYIKSYINIVSRLQKLVGGITDSMEIA
jgi:hypothetical protein